MAKNNFSEIKVRAAIMTGAILGFLCWIGGAILYVSTGYGAAFWHTFSYLPGVAGIVLGALGGALLGIIYNWTLKLK